MRGLSVIAGARLWVDDDVMANALVKRVGEIQSTPHRLFFDELANQRFAWLARRTCAIPKLAAAYSVKTNPRTELLAAAKRYGLLAEVISDGELERARAQSFGANSIIYNGPRPLRGTKVYCAFADSPEAYDSYVAANLADVLGARYRPSEIESRFGMTGDQLAECAQIARADVRVEAIGLSFHVRPQDFKGRTWYEIATEALDAAKRFQCAAAKPLQVLDIGGGWTPDGLENAFANGLPRFVKAARGSLASLEQVVIEPGQSLVTPCEAVAARILEVRRRADQPEAIVDAGYPDFPQVRSFDHRTFYLAGAKAVRLARGRWQIGGPTCLEYDIVADGVDLPEQAKAGDLVFVCDCGAYDASTAFDFAQGVRSRIS